MTRISAALLGCLVRLIDWIDDRRIARRMRADEQPYSSERGIW